MSLLRTKWHRVEKIYEEIGTSFPHIEASEYFSTTLKALKLFSMNLWWGERPRSRTLSLTCNIHSAKGGPRRFHGQLGSLSKIFTVLVSFVADCNVKWQQAHRHHISNNVKGLRR